jgi:hypothetical protein
MMAENRKVNTAISRISSRRFDDKEIQEDIRAVTEAIIGKPLPRNAARDFVLGLVVSEDVILFGRALEILRNLKLRTGENGNSAVVLGIFSSARKNLSGYGDKPGMEFLRTERMSALEELLR